MQQTDCDQLESIESMGLPSLDDITGQLTETAPSEAVPLVSEAPKIGTACIEVPMLPVGAEMSGYMARMRSIQVDLEPALCDRFRRWVVGLHNSHATFPTAGGGVSHVDSAADAFRWFISQLPE